MGLKMKSFKNILIDMTRWVSSKSERLVDFTEGSVIRTLLEAVATELEEYYFKTYINMQYAMEHSLYEAFGFELRGATPAYGNLTISLRYTPTTDFYIPKGTLFYTKGGANGTVYYETRDKFVISANKGLSQSIVVYATANGTQGNTLAGTITGMVNPMPIIATVTNEQPFTNGMEAETKEQRRERFTQFVNSRAKGTKDAIIYGTMETGNVAGCYVDDSQTGIVKVYAHDSAGNLSPETQKAIKNNLENYRCAGIPVFVIPATKKPIDVDVVIEVLPQFNDGEGVFKSRITSAIYDFFTYYTLGQDFMVSDLNAFIRNLDGIAIKNCKITEPISDVEVANNELILFGNVSVELIDYTD